MAEKSIRIADDTSGDRMATRDAFELDQSSNARVIERVDFAGGKFISPIGFPLRGNTRTLEFTSGGTYEILVGDEIEGDSSGATAIVIEITVDSGSWSGGDAVGTLIVKDQVGTFGGGDLQLAPGSVDYVWLASPAYICTGEYVLSLDVPGGADPGISEPAWMKKDGNLITKGTVCCASGLWAWGNDDYFTFYTIHYRPSPKVDPDIDTPILTIPGIGENLDVGVNTNVASITEDSVVLDLDAADDLDLDNQDTDFLQNLITVGDNTTLYISIEQSTDGGTVTITPILYDDEIIPGIVGILESKVFSQDFSFVSNSLYLLPVQSWDVSGAYKIGVHITEITESYNNIKIYGWTI